MLTLSGGPYPAGWRGKPVLHPDTPHTSHAVRPLSQATRPEDVELKQTLAR